MTQSADERLILMLEARVSEFEKRMAAAERRASGNFRGMQRGSKSATVAMERDMLNASARINAALATTSARIGQFGKAFAVSFGAAVLGGITTNLRGLVGSIADMADAADQIGMSTDQLQGLQVGFKLAGVEMDKSAEGLRTFVQRLGEAAEGEGDMAEAFARAGVKMTDANGVMRDTYDLLGEYAEIMRRAPDAATKMALATDAFGRGGKAMVTAMAGGRASIDDMVRAAKEGGYVLDRDLVQKAAELDDKFDLITIRISNMFKGGVVGAVELVAQVANLHAELSKVQDLFRQPEQAVAVLGEAVASALDGEALQAHAETVAALLLEYERLGAGGNALVPIMSRVADELRRLGEDDVAAELAAVAAAMLDLNARFDAGKVGAEAFEVEFGQLIDRATAAMTAVQSVDSPTFDGVIGRLGDLKTKLGEVITEALSLRAALPGGAGDPSTLPLAPSDGSSIITWTPDKSVPTNRPWTGTTVDLRNDDAPTRHGGGGRGSGRLDSLIAELQTARDAVVAWHAESLALLNNATEAQLAAIGGRHEALERLEAEHRERLREANEAARQMEVQAQEAMWGQLAGLMGAFGGKSKALAAAALATNTILRMRETAQHSAAAQVRALAELGPIAGPPAAAKIAAFGKVQMGLIAAAGVASALGGGGSGGGSAGAGSGTDTSGAGAGGAGPLRVMPEVFDPSQLYSGAAVRKWFDAIMDEAGSRGIIWGARV